MLSAFRQEDEEGNHISLKENLRRTKRLKDKLKFLAKSFNWGYFEVEGCYLEQGQTIPSIEKSFFVVADDNDVDFNKIMISLGKAFNQDSILLKSKKDNAYYVSTNQKSDKISGVKLGRFVPNVIGEFYSKLRGKPFIFKYSKPHHYFKNEKGIKINKILGKPNANKYTYLGIPNIYKQGNKFLVKKYIKGKLYKELFDTLPEAKTFLNSLKRFS